MKINKSLFILIGVYVFLFGFSAISSAYAELVHSILFLMVLSQSLNIVFGFAGLVNLGHAAFLGIGAYVFATLIYEGFDPYVSMILGGFISSFLALLIGVVVLRFRGPFFACGTAILAPAAQYFIIGTGVAGGYYGLTLYKQIGSLYNSYILLYILLILSVVIALSTFKLTKSPFGYSLKALREDHDAAQTVGVDALKCKLIAFSMSALFPGIVGGVMAFKTFWVTPGGAFNMMYTIEAILTILMGGSGSVTGPIIGALIYELLKDLLMRVVPGFQILVFGLLVIIIVLFAPEGVVGFLRRRFKKLSIILM